MTEQILDRLIYRECEYFIHAISGDALLSPKDFGLLPMGMSTACSRGYYMVYICDNNKLYLRDMTVFAETYPSIEKFSKYRSAYEVWDATTYTGLSPVSSFTGGLILGSNLRRGIGKGSPIYLSYWLASRTLIELKFRDGVLQKEVDYSEDIELELNKKDTDVNKLRDSVFPVEYDFMYPFTLAFGKKTL